MASLQHQGRASYAFFERNWNLTKRYMGWEIVWLFYNIINALSVTLISKNTSALGSNVTQAQVDALTLYLLIGTSVWSYLSLTFDGVTDLINIERWEGTIEHTFMAPISRFTHMIGSCWYAVVHGILFTFVQLIIVASFFHLDLSHANYLTAVFMLLLVRWLRHWRGYSAAALYRARFADVVHRAFSPAAHLRRLLSDQRLAWMDAARRQDFARDLRAGWVTRCPVE